MAVQSWWWIALLILIVAAVAAAAIACTLPPAPKTAGSVAAGAAEAATGAGVMQPASLPVPGLQYSKINGFVNTVSAMYWAGIPQPGPNPSADALLTSDQMRPIYAGEIMWNPINEHNALSWIVGTNTVQHQAVCPAGQVVTGLRVYVTDDSGFASHVNVHCQSVLDLGSPDATTTLGQILDVVSGLPVNVAGSAYDDFYASGMYLTAANALNGNIRVNEGNMLEDQSNTGRAPTDNYATPNPVNSGALQFYSVGGGNGNNHPWKPTTQDLHYDPGGSNDVGSGSNPTVYIVLTFLYYEYGDAPDAKPRTVDVNLWELDYVAPVAPNTATNGWRYDTANIPWAESIRFDPNRVIKVTYDNSGEALIKGIAVANKGAKAVVGGGTFPDGGEVTLKYFDVDSSNPLSPFPAPYWIGFNSSTRNTDPISPNFQISFDIVPFVTPANRMWTVPKNSAAATAFNAAAATALLVVTDPTCTGVNMSQNDRGNPINVQNVGDGYGVNPFSEAACGARALALCKNTLSSDDPYCACINSKPIPGLSAIGLNLDLRCMSNGGCMAANPLQTWMSYTHADQANKCGKIAVDVCAFLWNMTAETITLSNNTLTCSNVSGKCPDCDVGTGPCKSVVPFQGHTACRTRQPDGTCGTGFTDCDPQPAPTTPKTTFERRNQEIAAVVSAGVVLLILVFVPVWLATSKKKSAK
jgi:hypothetical protein